MTYDTHHSYMDGLRHVPVDRLQMNLSTKCFITHITVMWAVSTMCELMSVQKTLKIKWFITDSTAIWVFSTV